MEIYDRIHPGELWQFTDNNEKGDLMRHDSLHAEGTWQVTDNKQNAHLRVMIVYILK